MFSVIVHGRNDAHGYNLHKRVALSLNAVAHLLGESDEILFVDWNTPDALPTLPEAIADTLTAHCRRLLRVLRVRPDLHARFAGRTHLPVLDPVARNVALRRADPTNPWILSTTTDMILVPRHHTERLEALVADLGPGLYHCARFDVPEVLWESLDRNDPAAAIAACARWGRDLHLDEMVTADPSILFDGPGDFQLVPRDALVAIDGFDESMLFTYHMDSNLARRLAMPLGPPRPVIDRLAAYHCHHYRIGSIHHAETRVENDPDRYIHNVARADLPVQAGAWGLPDEELEEIRLTAVPGAPTLAALGRVLEPRTGPIPRSEFVAERFNDLRYDSDHVLPFVADVLATLPAAADLAVFAADAAFAQKLARLWTALGRSGRLLIPVGGAMPAGPAVALAMPDLLERANAFLFEFGLGADFPEGRDGRDWRDTDRAGLRRVAGALAAAAAHERRQIAGGAAAERRFIAVNAIHNTFQPLVAELLHVTHTPFITRLRQGTVRAPRPVRPTPPELSAWLGPALDRRRPVPLAEAATARDSLERLAAGHMEGVALAPAVIALLDHPATMLACEPDPARHPELRRRTLAIRPAHRFARRLGLPPAAARAGVAPAVSKPCGLEDWDHPDWHRWLVHLAKARESEDVFHRNRGTWEEAHTLYAIDRTARFGAEAAVLILAAEPHDLAGHLTGLFGRVDVLVPAGTADPAAWRNLPMAYDPERLRVHRNDAALPAAGYDAVLVPGHGASAGGTRALAGLLERAARHLRPGGVVGLSGELVLAGAPHRGWPDSRLAMGRLEEVTAAHAGLTAAGDADWTVSDDTLDRTARQGSGEERRPHMALQAGTVLHTTALWFLRKERDAPADAWPRLAEALTRAAAAPVDLAPRFVGHEAAASGSLAERPAGAAPAPLLADAVLHLPSGAYRLAVDAAATGHGQALMAVAERYTGQGPTEVLGWHAWRSEDLAGAGPNLLDFSVPAPDDGGMAVTVVLRLVHLGRAGVTVRGLCLEGPDYASP